MFHLVFITQYLLCGVSIFLTALFCVEFSSSALISSIIMVIVGVALELSKYTFWYYTYLSNGCRFISILLVIFSLSASVAFFVAHEQSNVEIARKKTTEYRLNQRDILSLQHQIQKKTALVDRRLASKFHAQWEQAEALTQEIVMLEDRLKGHMEKMDKVGQVKAYQRVNTSALFLMLSKVFGTSVRTVTIIAYSILALLIESCSLGAISLSGKIRATKPTNGNSKNREGVDTDQRKLTITEKRNVLKDDIITGKTAPVLRWIRRSGDYKLSEENIRQVLVELKEAGVLTDGQRCLQLAKK